MGEGSALTSHPWPLRVLGERPSLVPASCQQAVCDILQAQPPWGKDRTGDSRPLSTSVGIWDKGPSGQPSCQQLKDRRSLSGKLFQGHLLAQQAVPTRRSPPRPRETLHGGEPAPHPLGRSLGLGTESSEP